MYVRINDGTTGVNIEISNYKNIFIFFTEVNAEDPLIYL